MAADDKLLAIAAHLHVLLRRRTGRVTDMEWLAQNPDYAREIVRFARAKAAEEQAPDLEEWAGKLEAALAGQPAEPPRTPLVQEALRQRREEPAAPRYVGGLR